MIRLFLRYVIGGQTGKRESAWFAFLLWAGWSAWMVYTEFTGGPELALSESMWMVVTPFVFTWLGTAHGFEWVSRQTRWGGTPMSLRDAASIASGGQIPGGVLDALPDDPAAAQRHYARMDPAPDGARPVAAAPNDPPPPKPRRT